MEKTYIVTARSAEDAARKVKELRAKDAPIMEPTEANYKKFLDEAKRVIGEAKLEDLEKKFNDVQDNVQFKVVALLDDSTTTGNIWWDFKKILEQDGADADIDMVKKNYEEFIKLFEDFKDKYVAAGEKLADDKNKKTVTGSWKAWFEKALKRAHDNLDACMKDAEARKAKEKEKAEAPKQYNKTK